MGILKINEANSYLKECLVNTVAEELPDKKLKIEPRLLFLSKEQFDKGITYYDLMKGNLDVLKKALL